MLGIHTALVTPFTAEGAVDWPAWQRLLDRQWQAGIHGVVVCGTTGESPTLDDDEQAELLAVTLAASKGRGPVTMGVGTNDTKSTVKKAEKAAKAGADYGLLVFPYYNKPNPDGLRAHVREVAKTGLRLVLYHVPGRTGQKLSPQLLAELAGSEGVAAVKEATGDLTYGGDVLTRTTTPILSGDDFTFLPLLAMGGTGCISVLSNVDPARTVAIYEAFSRGDLARARSLMHLLWPLTSFLFSDTNPVPAKAALAELGLCRTDVRLPLAAYSGPSAKPVLAPLELR